jgi:hypothetical protein
VISGSKNLSMLNSSKFFFSESILSARVLATQIGIFLLIAEGLLTGQAHATSVPSQTEENAFDLGQQMSAETHPHDPTFQVTESSNQGEEFLSTENQAITALSEADATEISAPISTHSTSEAPSLTPQSDNSSEVTSTVLAAQPITQSIESNPADSDSETTQFAASIDEPTVITNSTSTVETGTEVNLTSQPNSQPISSSSTLNESEATTVAQVIQPGFVPPVVTPATTYPTGGMSPMAPVSAPIPASISLPLPQPSFGVGHPPVIAIPGQPNAASANTAPSHPASSVRPAGSVLPVPAVAIPRPRSNNAIAPPPPAVVPPVAATANPNGGLLPTSAPSLAYPTGIAPTANPSGMGYPAGYGQLANPMAQFPGQTVMGQPIVGQPTFGQIPNGSYGVGQYGLGQVVPTASPYPATPWSQPAVGQPVLGQPVLGQPALGQPILGQPILGQAYPMQPPGMPLSTPVISPVLLPSPLQPTLPTGSQYGYPTTGVTTNLIPASAPMGGSAMPPTFSNPALGVTPLTSPQSVGLPVANPTLSGSTSYGVPTNLLQTGSSPVVQPVRTPALNPALVPGLPTGRLPVAPVVSPVSLPTLPMPLPATNPVLTQPMSRSLPATTGLSPLAQNVPGLPPQSIGVPIFNPNTPGLNSTYPMAPMPTAPALPPTPALGMPLPNPLGQAAVGGVTQPQGIPGVLFLEPGRPPVFVSTPPSSGTVPPGLPLNQPVRMPVPNPTSSNPNFPSPLFSQVPGSTAPIPGPMLGAPVPGAPVPNAPVIGAPQSFPTAVPQAVPFPLPPSSSTPGQPEFSSPATEPYLGLQGIYIFLDEESSARLRLSGYYPLTPHLLVGGSVDLATGEALGDDGVNINELYLATTFPGLENLRFVVGQLDLTSYFDRNSFAKDSGRDFFNSIFQTNPALAQAGLGSRPGALANWSITDNLEVRGAIFSSAANIGDFSIDGYAAEAAFRTGNLILRGTYASGRDDFEGVGTDRIEAYGANAEFFIPGMNMGLFARYGHLNNYALDFDSDTFSAGMNLFDVFSRGDRLGLAYGRGLSDEGARREADNPTPDALELFYDFRAFDNLRLGFSIQQVNDFSETVAGFRVRTELDITPGR